MDALSTAVSGMQAAQLDLDVTANNIANVSTPGFQPDRVALAAAPGGGVQASITPGQAPPTLAGVPAGQQPSGTDLTTEMAGLIQAPLMYAADARVVQTVDRTSQSLLDLFA